MENYLTPTILRDAIIVLLAGGALFLICFIATRAVMEEFDRQK